MTHDLATCRARAAAAADAADAATSRIARERCAGAALWWFALVDALEAGDDARAAELGANVVYLETPAARGGSPHPHHEGASACHAH